MSSVHFDHLSTTPIEIIVEDDFVLTNSSVMKWNEDNIWRILESGFHSIIECNEKQVLESSTASEYVSEKIKRNDTVEQDNQSVKPKKIVNDVSANSFAYKRDKPRSCDKCRKTHQKCKHDQACTNFCSFCKKMFATQFYLKIHERTHKGERPFPCDYCDKRFASRQNKKQHERIHTGEKPYGCRFCGQHFMWIQQKINHSVQCSAEVHQEPSKTDRKPVLRSHTGIVSKKEYNSKQRKDTIKKSRQSVFPGRKLLQPVIKACDQGQTKERPFACQYCDLRFAWLKNVKRHEKIHTGEKSFLCCVCGKAFYRKDSLMEHQQLHDRKA